MQSRDRFYWTDTLGSIFWANFSGFGAEAINQSVSVNAVVGPAIDSHGQKIYWIEAPGGWHVRRANLDGSNPEALQVGTGGEGFALELAVDPGAISIAVAPKPELSSRAMLDTAHPNPFRAITTISYTLSEAVRVDFEVFDSLGRSITNLARGMQPAGKHEVSLDASGLTSGMYWYRLTAGNFSSTKQMILLR